MSIYTFLTDQEFNDLCELRLQKVSYRILDLREKLDRDELTRQDLADNVKEFILDLAKIQLDVESVIRKEGN